MIIARFDEGQFRTSDCLSTDVDDRQSDTNIPLVDILRYLASQNSKQLQKLREGVITRTVGITEEIPIGMPFLGKISGEQRTVIEIDKGSNDGIYKGMPLCSNDSAYATLTVFAVQPDKAFAILEGWPAGDPITNQIGNVPLRNKFDMFCDAP